MNNRAESKDALKKAVALDPNHPGSQSQLGREYTTLGYPSPAFFAPSRFLILEPATARSSCRFLHFLQR